jgi:hypothetical protein
MDHILHLFGLSETHHCLDPIFVTPGNLLLMQLRLSFIEILDVNLVLEAASSCDYFQIALLIAFNLCTFVFTLLSR